MARCVNCGRRIEPGAPDSLCPGCAACETMYDALMRRLKRMLFSGLRMAVIASAAALLVRLFMVSPSAKLISMVLLYLAVSEAVLAAARYLAALGQLRHRLREESKPTE